MRLRRTPFEGETGGTDVADGTPGRKEKKEAEVKRLDPAPLLRALPQGGDPPSGLSHAFSSFTYDVFILYIVLSYCQPRWGLWRLQRKLYVEVSSVHIDIYSDDIDLGRVGPRPLNG